MAVTDDAIVRVKEMIVSGELKPGDRLRVRLTWQNASGCRATRCAKP